MQSSTRRSNIMCCVVGCHNSYSNTKPDVKFYNFPGRWYEKERREIWIQRVRRASKWDDKDTIWEPKLHHKICSNHFINNAKSDNPLEPSYHPTIFPSVYKKPVEEKSIESQRNRFVRAQERAWKKSSKNTNTFNETEEPSTANVMMDMEIPQITHVDFSCQVSFENDNVELQFVCCLDTTSVKKSTVSTQANIPHNLHKTFKSHADKCVGNSDELKCDGFYGYDSIKNDRQLNSLCGVTTAVFILFLNALEKVDSKCKLSLENQLLLYLMKIKLGLSNSALAVLFNMHPSSCYRIFVKLLNEVTQKFATVVQWPSRNVIRTTLPDSFKVHYPNCRVIIDCSEIRIQHPRRVDDKIYTYSHYKGTHTAKFLIGIAPNGFISFVSKCYGGKASDPFITNDCGILNLLEPGDQILADKGFPGIKCDDVIIVLPPFVHDGILTQEEVVDTYNIASVRIHVERSIQRLKIYGILEKISYNLFPYIDAIISMCCILTNLQPPTIKEHKDGNYYDDDDVDDSNQ